ncbi:MAG: tripartite tricarboxylate transporter substrate binding protein [Mailhella sp.]|nr:tripartite tricarboxylate transporter substrate binding protein [Mailhella sp.]
MFKRIISIAAAAALSLTCLAAPSQAAWPERPVKLLLGSAAGSSIDMIGRIIAQKLTDKFGQPFVPQNVAGGGLGLFAMTLKNAPSDGYTIGFGLDNNFTNVAHDPNAKFRLADFKPLCTVFNGDTSYIVAPDKKWKNVKEALEASKQEPITFLFQTAMDRNCFQLLVSQVPGAQVKLMPQKSPSAIMSAIMGGHGDIGSSGGLHFEQARAGKVRTLSLMTSTPSPNYPDVELVKDLFDKVVCPDAYRLIIVRADFPAEAEQALSAALKEICSSDEFKAAVEKLHFIPRYNDAAASAEIFAREYADLEIFWKK